ncbi:MAG: LutC/YkgG family protein [Gaiellaceae bacterium]
MERAAEVSARELILERVRTALADGTAAPAAPRGYRSAGSLDSAARTALFCERVGEYRADVRRISPGGEAAEIAAVCASLGVRRLVIPPGLPASRRPEGLELVEDTQLDPHSLDELDGVLTGCTVAVAETGTIVLTAAPDEGRRAITLVPDRHLCLVDESQIVELVPEAIAGLAGAVRERRPITLISGPSATSDIELDRVEGVHGPRTLVVLVVG